VLHGLSEVVSSRQQWMPGSVETAAVLSALADKVAVARSWSAPQGRKILGRARGRAVRIEIDAMARHRAHGSEHLDGRPDQQPRLAFARRAPRRNAVGGAGRWHFAGSSRVRSLISSIAKPNEFLRRAECEEWTTDCNHHSPSVAENRRLKRVFSAGSGDCVTHIRQGLPLRRVFPLPSRSISPAARTAS
jgi:hypothetical protein